MLLELAYRTEMNPDIARNILEHLKWDIEKALERAREMGYNVRTMDNQSSSTYSTGQDLTTCKNLHLSKGLY